LLGKSCCPFAMSFHTVERRSFRSDIKGLFTQAA
jgi:hypothetical protein